MKRDASTIVQGPSWFETVNAKHSPELTMKAMGGLNSPARQSALFGLIRNFSPVARLL